MYLTRIPNPLIVKVKADAKLIAEEKKIKPRQFKQLLIWLKYNKLLKSKITKYILKLIIIKT